MNPSILRVIGFLFLIVAAVTAVLNLHRVADLGMPWLAPLFLFVGIIVLLLGRRRKG